MVENLIFRNTDQRSAIDTIFHIVSKYHDISWHSPQIPFFKNSLPSLLPYFNIIRNMALKADSSFFKNTTSSVKSSSVQQAQFWSLVHKFTCLLYKNEPKYDEKNWRLIYCNQYESYLALLTTNIKKHLAKDHIIFVNLRQSYTKK